MCYAWFLTATLCLQDVGPGEGSAERFTLSSQSWACLEALNQFSYLERELKLAVTRDTVRSLLFVESLMLSKEHPCICPTIHPPTLLSIQLCTHPTIYQPICQADATFCRNLFKIPLQFMYVFKHKCCFMALQCGRGKDWVSSGNTQISLQGFGNYKYNNDFRATVWCCKYNQHREQHF